LSGAVVPLPDCTRSSIPVVTEAVAGPPGTVVLRGVTPGARPPPGTPVAVRVALLAHLPRPHKLVQVQVVRAVTVTDSPGGPRAAVPVLVAGTVERALWVVPGRSR